MLGAVLVMTLVIRFAVPVRDGDFFWHVKCGEYMVENKTLIPDHAIYSWTPANNKAIYCTWIADILLYSIHQIGGMPLLYTFRYLCFFALIGVIWIYAWHMGQGKDVFTFLLLLIVLLSSQGAAYLKPEIISMVFMSITSFVYFAVRSCLWKKWGTKPFLLYPLLFLFWVNSHGVFIFGLALLALITLGEIMNKFFSPRSSLPNQGLRHLIIGLFLSLAATFITPYGYKLHLYLFNDIVLGKMSPGMKTTLAYATIFKFPLSHLVDFWVIMLLFFLVLFLFLVLKVHELNFAILLPTIFLAFYFVRYNRAAFYWPAFWSMSLIYSRNKVRPFWYNIPRLKTVFSTGIILLFLFLSARAIYDSGLRPFKFEWLGFGTSYFNPVQESAFLKNNRPGRLLYNSYNTGGYLIYDLYPVYKVFIDPRYFPYKEWFAGYLDFQNGRKPLSEFSRKYPFDVAILDYFSSQTPIAKFLFSKKWDPVFYGPSAIVFVKKDINFRHDIKTLDKHRFDNLRNLEQAYTVFITAQNLNDLDTSGYILQFIRKEFSYFAGYKNVVRVCTLYQEGMTAFAKKNYEKALAKLNKTEAKGNTIRANWALKQLWNWKAKQFVEKGKYKEALPLVEKIIKVYPSSVESLYNAGILAYLIEDLEKGKKRKAVLRQSKFSEKILNKDTLNWNDYLERFLKLAPNHEKAQIANQVLEGKGLPKKVPLIF